MEENHNRYIPRPGCFYRHFKGSLFQIVGTAFYCENEEEMVVYQALYPPYQMWVRPLRTFLAPVDRLKYPDAKQQFMFEEIVFRTSVEETDTNKINHENTGDKKREEVTGITDRNMVQKEQEHKVSDDVTLGKNRDSFVEEEDFPKEQSESFGEAGEEKLSSSKQKTSFTEESEKTLSEENNMIGNVVDDTLLHRALQSRNAEAYLEGKISNQEILQRGLIMILDAKSYTEKIDLLIGLRPYLTEGVLYSIAIAHDISLEDGDLETQYQSLLDCLETLQHYEGGRLR